MAETKPDPEYDTWPVGAYVSRDDYLGLCQSVSRGAPLHECQIVPAAISTEDPSNGPPHNYRRRIRQREQAQVAAAHFKCCRYRRRQNRCRPGPDLDPDLGQLLLGRRRPGLDPDLDRDLAVPDSYLWRGRRNFQPATLVSAKGGMFTEHRTDAVEQKPASDHARRR